MKISQMTIPVIIIIAVCLWLFLPLVIDKYGLFIGWPKLDDPFSSIESLFSALAFILLFYAIQLQRKDLKIQQQELQLQRQELAETRKELKRSAEAQNELAQLTRESNELQQYLNRDIIIPYLEYKDINLNIDNFIRIHQVGICLV